LTFWQSGLSSNCEARGGLICLEFLNNNLALIYIQFSQFEFFFGQLAVFVERRKEKMRLFLEKF
jgi:hypothetical protein